MSKPTSNTYIKNQQSGENIIGKGTMFDRIRRITGYLVGSLDRFNNAKKKEVIDRVKHGIDE